MESLANTVVELLKEAHMTMTTVESCTGGLLSSTLVDVPGVSEVLNQAYVTYANEAKEALVGVRKETLEAYGAVSEQTAREMAEGGAAAAGAQAALSVTGIAGPEGGTAQKPVGLVYIGCFLEDSTVVEKHIFQGSRRQVREQSAAAALTLLKKRLQQKKGTEVG